MATLCLLVCKSIKQTGHGTFACKAETEQVFPHFRMKQLCVTAHDGLPKAHQHYSRPPHLSVCCDAGDLPPSRQNPANMHRLCICSLNIERLNGPHSSVITATSQSLVSHFHTPSFRLLSFYKMS